MIDFGEAVVPSRRTIPRASVNAVDANRGRGPGSTRSLSQRVRSTSTSAELEQARRRLAASRTKSPSTTRPGAPSSVSRPISPKDVADRYKSRTESRPAAPSRGATSRPVRSASDRSNAARSDKAASNAARIANLRRDTAARSAAARTKAARQKNARADESRNVRIKNARVKASATDAKTRSNDARIDAARQQYANRVAAARRNNASTTPGVSVDGRPGGGRGNQTGVVGGRSPIEAVGASGRGGVGAGFNGSYGYGVDPYYNNCFWNYWGGSYSNSWCSWFWSPFYATGLCWQNHWLYGGGWNNRSVRRSNSRFNNCIWLGPFLPATNSFIIYDDPEPEIIYVEVPAQQDAEEVVFIEGEAVVQDAGPSPRPRESTDPGLQRELNRAAAYYLTQGDRAFREARFGDAAHFYAKAVEFSSDSGILYLVLSDALFATGDYRYAAYALRQAFDREPSLASNLVDKRDFYSEPSLFDRQLGTLERYVDDHVLDMDARLVLAANYLFSGRPDLCLSFIESPFSEELRGTPEGLLLQQSANHVMFGDEVEEAAAAAPATAATPEGSTEY